MTYRLRAKMQASGHSQQISASRRCAGSLSGSSATAISCRILPIQRFRQALGPISSCIVFTISGSNSVVRFSAWTLISGLCRSFRRGYGAPITPQCLKRTILRTKCEAARYSCSFLGTGCQAHFKPARPEFFHNRTRCSNLNSHSGAAA